MAKTATLKPPAGSAGETQESKFRELDAALRRMATGGTDPADFDIVAAAGFAAEKLDEELRRQRRIISALERCPSLATLQARQKGLETLTTETAKERKKLEAELAEVQARIGGQIAALDRRLKEEERAVHLMEDARQTLRKQCPEHIQRRARLLKSQFRKTDSSARMQKLEGRIEPMQRALSVEFNGYKTFQYLQNTQPGSVMDAPSVRAHKQWNEVGERVTRQALEEIQARYRAELPKFVAELEALKAQCAATEAEIDSALDYYLAGK